MHVLQTTHNLGLSSAGPFEMVSDCEDGLWTLRLWNTSPTRQFAYTSWSGTLCLLHSLPTVSVRIDIRLFIRLLYQ